MIQEADFLNSQINPCSWGPDAVEDDYTVYEIPHTLTLPWSQRQELA